VFSPLMKTPVGAGLPGHHEHVAGASTLASSSSRAFFLAARSSALSNIPVSFRLVAPQPNPGVRRAPRPDRALDSRFGGDPSVDWRISTDQEF